MTTVATETRTPKIVFALIFMLSALVLGFLFWLIYAREPAAQEQAAGVTLPFVNAALNTLSASFLVLGYRAIRRRDKENHRRFMLSALASSLLFLATYVTYHYLHGDTPFTGQGPVRIVYFGILISHIMLSAGMVPMILTTLWFAFTGSFRKHRSIARFTLPVWLYVSVTGVLIVAFLKLFG